MNVRIASRALILCLCSALISFAQTSKVQPRLTQPIDEQKLVRLAGNTHPLARAEFDRGAAPDSMPANRMLLLLQRSAEQEATLQKFLEEQQTKSAPNYHHWLTPEQFGQQYGPADADIATVTNWLQSQGFRVNKVGAGRTVIEFSGTAGLVRQAFRTEIHKFVVSGEEHWANASDPQIPAALQPVVGGIVTLHNFRKRPQHHIVNPQFTITVNGITHYGVGPYDFATIYNVLPQWNAGIDGTGQTIAIVARSNINLQDVRSYRSLFGLPAKDPVVILDGPDPGLLAVTQDELEADLDVQLSGGIAKGATIDVVVSEGTEVADGVDLSAFYIIDNNIAGIMSESFGACELMLGTAGNNFYEALWEQGAAQGIGIILSAGDSGSAGCDTPFVQGGTVTGGLAVSGLASTHFNVSVGGTDFDDATTHALYWGSNDPVTQRSAMSYPPEMTWNESCAAAGLSGCTTVTQSSFTGGGSGGPSNCATSTAGVCTGGRSKPAWQTGTGVPADGVRDQPDASFFAGGVSGSFYPICEADLNPGGAACSLSFPGFIPVEGTSASAPAFAGVMALVQQKMGGIRQGNPNYVLYPLAAMNPATCNSSQSPTANCIFYDITKGNNSMPCAGGSPNCSKTTLGGSGVLADPAHTSNPAWLTTPGYDMATGLGTINVSNLVNNWSAVHFTPTTTTLSLGTAGPVTHGTAVAVNIAVSPAPPTTKPEAVSLLGGPGTTPMGIDGFTLNSSGNTSGATTKLLPGGTYTVTAHYGGDGLLGASDSPAFGPITVTKETSSTFLHLVTFDLFGNLLSYGGISAAYGSPYILRADVTNTADGFPANGVPLCSSGCPTGNVVITANSLPLDGGNFPLNSQGFTEDQPIQLAASSTPYALNAAYAGDNSFNGSAANLNITITKAATALGTVTVPPNPVNINQQFNLSTTVTTQSSGVPPSGTVTFLDNGTAITAGTITQTPVNCCASGFSALQVTLSGATIATAGTHSITATYSGDGNYLNASTVSAATITVLGPSVGVQAAPINVTRGSSTNATITLTSMNGLSGQVAVACTIPAGMNEATCTPTTQNVNVPNGGQTTATVAIAATAPHTIGSLRRSSRWASFGFVLVGGLLFLIPARRRRSRVLLLLILLVILSVAFFGCGGGGGSSSNTDPGTAPGVYQVGITVTQNSTTVGTGSVTVTVQ